MSSLKGFSLFNTNLSRISDDDDDQNLKYYQKTVKKDTEKKMKSVREVGLFLCFNINSDTKVS